MTNTKPFVRKSSLLFTALLLSLPSGTLANPTLTATLERSEVVVKKDSSGKVTFIGSNSPTGIKPPAGSASLVSTPEQSAQNFVNAYAPAFGVANPSRDLAPTKSYKIDGLTTAKYQQKYNGVEIIGAEINVNLDRSGNLLAMTGEAVPNLNLSTTPKISATQAQNTALKAVKKQYNLNPGSVNVSKPKLSIYQPGIIDRQQGRSRLVWLVKVKPKNPQAIDQIVMVDAINKDNVVLTFNNNPDARNRKTYDANNTATLPGTLRCSETTTGANCVVPAGTNGTTDTARAHSYAGDTYNFYFTNHGRDSIDGFGLPVVSTARYFEFGLCPNAFWDGTQMVYCEGLAADDVVGHELTHGVTQYTSNLFYYYDSGAINESLSDVWGEFIDLTNGKGNDAATVRWQIGEDTVGLGVIRDMKNPPAFNQPDKMTSTLFWKSADDNGGVHINSGINNKAVFLMVDGGTFNGKTITGIGITKVAKIYYRVQTTLLTSGSNYNDLYNYVNQSCTSLVGTSGITAADCVQVKNALLAVEMDKQPTAAYQPQASICPVGKNLVNTFFDDVEGSLKWNFVALLPLSSSTWELDSGYATSGTNILYTENSADRTDSAAVMKTAVTIPTGAFLHFRHSFGFEFAGTSNYDGGVLEYSIGNTGVWTDAKPLFVEGQNYKGAIFNGTGADNTLKGRQGFVNDSHGYVSSKYNLATLAGKTVRFRFRQANDTGNFFGQGIGWVVDDVRIYRCL
jgi:Zn-dependent metalloprotease